jgi:hypothetical protein
VIRNMVLWLVVAASVGSVSLGCSDRPTTEDDTAIPFHDLYKNRYSGIFIQRGEVISTPDRWQTAWDELGATQSPQLPLPVVDFANTAVVLVAMGENPDACWTVEIEAVHELPGLLHVTAANIRARASCSCPPVVVQPAHVVSLGTVIETAVFDFKTKTQGPECN